MGKSFKRRIYIINKNFQYRFISIVLLLVLLNSIFLFWNFYVGFKGVLTKVTSSQIVGELMPQMHKVAFSEHFIAMIFSLLVPFCIVGIICVFASHQIAGPAYHIAKVMKDIREGKLSTRVHLRKEDTLKELATEINLTLAHFENSLAEIRTCAIAGNVEKIKKITDGYTTLRNL